MTSPRRKVWRATLSALAGGGLTAASLGGPLSGGAFAAEAPAGSPTSTDGSSPPVTAPDSSAQGSGAQETGSGQPTTSTSTTPATTPVTTTTGSEGSTPAPVGAPAPTVMEVPTVVVRERKQKTTPSTANRNLSATHGQPPSAQPSTGGANAPKVGVASGPNGVAAAPQVVADQAGALAAELNSAAVSVQALSFYRIPLFLLPIYQAAAVQYGVPWQILAAINEIETDYGTDQSVSTAGAVGWMQFMPATWLQYGVDALDAGYADPYNPVDAIFAAARYLRAAGAQKDLRTAILAYNHSTEYADSVLLRAKLISSYPQSVIATLTGLTDGRLPVTGKRVAWDELLSGIPSSSATANATAAHSAASAGSAALESAGAASALSGAAAKPAAARAVPGSSAPPAPAAVAAAATDAHARALLQFVDLLSARNAVVVAVQDGRIVRLGDSHKLGKYVILRDVYGDVFTYAGLGSIAPSYRLPKAPRTAGVTAKGAADTEAATGGAPAPSQAASAGRQLPLTLRVKTSVEKPHAGQGTTGAKGAPGLGASASGDKASAPASSAESAPAAGESTSASAESTPSGTGKVRLFAHPGNPDALAAVARATRDASPHSSAGRQLPLRRGSVVARGTVLGRVSMPPRAKDGHLLFAIQPAGDASTIDPRSILENWKQLDVALHPRGAKGESDLVGATASGVFLLSKIQLEREILSDPGITLPACSRHEVAAGAIDKRALAVLAFLSRSGLEPTVGTLRCGDGAYAVSGYVPEGHIGDAVAITEINGVPVAGHQGAGSITDTTIRALLTLQGEFVPNQIVSLMRYPGAPSTLARRDHGDYIEIGFSQASKRLPAQKSSATTAVVAHSAGPGQTAPSPLEVSSDLSAAQWDRLIMRIAALPVPTVRAKPSSSAISDSNSSTPPRAASSK